MTLAEFRAMREEIREFVATKTWVSYPALVDAAIAHFHCTRDDAEYAIKDLPLP